MFTEVSIVKSGGELRWIERCMPGSVQQMGVKHRQETGGKRLI
jgi:hypothetical protein